MVGNFYEGIIIVVKIIIFYGVLLLVDVNDEEF